VSQLIRKIKEEFAEEEESEIQPERITINIGGRPAKTAGLIDIEDLIRRGDVIEAVQYFGAEDGIINQFSRRFELRWHPVAADHARACVEVQCCEDQDAGSPGR
jgi:hypothetical protein